MPDTIITTVPAAEALPAIGGQLFYGAGTSPETWTLISNRGSITGLGLSAQVVDVTNNNTTAPWRHKVPTLLDPGDMGFDLFFIPSDPGHQAILKLFADRGLNEPGVPIPFRYVFPDGDQTVWLFNGFVTQLKFNQATDNVVRAAAVITATGEPTFPTTP